MSQRSEAAAVEERVRRRFLTDRDANARADVDPVQRLSELLVDAAPLMAPEEVRERARRLAVEVVGLGRIQLLLDQPGVTDVLVNGPGEIWIERAGRLVRSGSQIDRAGIDRAIERLVGPLGLRADRAHPVVDARLPDGTRVSVVLPPLAVDGPVLAIRRHRRESLPLEAFCGARQCDVLRAAVRDRLNVVVFGPTGAGKTTLLNALCAELPRDERIVSIEDVAELRLPGAHVVRLEARPGTADGVGRAAIRDLVRAALRLRPDRIVVGEVRGAEAIDMVWALSTGHDGGFSTCHASSGPDALRRIETMCLLGGEGLSLAAVREQVHSAIDLLVGVARTGGGTRRVVEIRRVPEDLAR